MPLAGGRSHLQPSMLIGRGVTSDKVKLVLQPPRYVMLTPWSFASARTESLEELGAKSPKGAALGVSGTYLATSSSLKPQQ